MSSAANRMRVMRERRRAGVVPLTIEVQIDRLALALAETLAAISHAGFTALARPSSTDPTLA